MLTKRLFQSLTCNQFHYRFSKSNHQNKFISTKSLESCHSIQKKLKNDKVQWYHSSHHYWTKASCDNSGVMMGRDDLSSADIICSQQFINHIRDKKSEFKHESVLDCGAGIGRVSQNLLSKHFTNIDILEKCHHFIDEAKRNQNMNKIRHFYCCGLEEFSFPQKYDCIWIQWVLVHLQDQEAIEFLRKAKLNLNNGGVIVVKENYSTKRELDLDDYTITRSLFGWKSLFYESHCQIIEEKQQLNWPQELYPAKMWALT